MQKCKFFIVTIQQFSNKNLISNASHCIIEKGKKVFVLCSTFLSLSQFDSQMRDLNIFNFGAFYLSMAMYDVCSTCVCKTCRTWTTYGPDHLLQLSTYVLWWLLPKKNENGLRPCLKPFWAHLRPKSKLETSFFQQ